MRRLITLAAAATFVLAACGGDDDDATTDTTSGAVTTAPPATTAAADTTAAPATTAAPGTTAAPDTTAAVTPSVAPATTTGGAGYVVGADPQADAAALAWTTALDSARPFEEKAPFIEGAAELRATIDAYGTTGTQLGGITIVPTDVVVAGPVATVTYDIHFAGQPAYGDQTGVVTLTDGTWIVGRDQFCAFMALARGACPA